MPPTNRDTLGTPAGDVNNVWGQSQLATVSFLTLPSGQTCHAKPIGLQGVMEHGLLGGADSLTAFVGKEHIRKKKGQGPGKPDVEEIDARSIMSNPDTLRRIVKLVDQTVPLIVVSPPVYLHMRQAPDSLDTEMIPPEDRIPDAIYTDMIGLEDKMFLFTFATSGVRDAVSFRQKSGEAVGDVADGAGIPDDTVVPGENRKQRRKRPPRRG
jgi:hypothetical protein